MTRNIVIQVFLDQTQYGDVKEAVLVRNLTSVNDSDMIRKILYDWTKKVYDLNITAGLVAAKTAELKEQSSQKDAIIEGLRAEIRHKNNDIEILQGNLASKVKEKKKHE